MDEIARWLGDTGIDRGDLAALRRLDPDHPRSSAFWRLVVRFGLEDRGPSQLARWGLIVHGIALMAPRSHDPSTPLGAALWQARVLEQRLDKLLAARGRQLQSLIPPLCRYLRAKGQPINWRTLAELVLWDGRDNDRAEDCRREIARHYYAAERRAQPRSSAA